jgi:trigger factor
LKIDVQRLDSWEAALTVEVEPERLQAAMKTAARRLSEKRPLPGFRKGKAPYALVLRHFGEEYVRSEAIEELGQKIYQEALDQSELEPYAAGSLNDIELEPLVFKYTVPLQPEVDLGDYRSVRLPYAMPEVTDEDVDKSLEHLREHQAVLEPVERPAEMGDVVTLDVAGTLTDKPEPEFLMKDEAASLLLDPEAEWPLPGFSEKLVGISAGEERQIDMSAPDDYANETLKGRPAHFDVKVSAVKSRTLPEWNDELAKEIGEFDTVADLRAAVREQLEQNTRRAYDTEYVNSVKDIVTAGATVHFPPVLIEREIDNLADDLDRRLREQNLNLEDYMRIENRTRESVRDELRPRAEDRLKWALVLGRVIEEEHLDLEAGEVDRQIRAMTDYFGKDGQRMTRTLSTPTGRRSIAMDMMTDKAIDRLVAIAKGEAPSEAAEAETAPEAAAAEGASEAAAEAIAEPATAEAASEPTPEAPSETAAAEAAGEPAAAAAPETMTAEAGNEPTAETNAEAPAAGTTSEPVAALPGSAGRVGEGTPEPEAVQSAPEAPASEAEPASAEAGDEPPAAEAQG